MAIVIKSKKITEDIVDENGNVMGKISYNPEDTTIYTKLTDIMKDLIEISNEMKMLQEKEQIPNEKITNIEEIDKYKEYFEKMNLSLHKCDEKIENIKIAIDSIFGKGTCDVVMDGSNDIDMLSVLIENVIPNFKKAREGKVNKYLSNEEVEQLDVME